jgi:hypothetical protein
LTALARQWLEALPRYFGLKVGVVGQAGLETRIREMVEGLPKIAAMGGMMRHRFFVNTSIQLYRHDDHRSLRWLYRFLPFPNASLA